MPKINIQLKLEVGIKIHWINSIFFTSQNEITIYCYCFGDSNFWTGHLFQRPGWHCVVEPGFQGVTSPIYVPVSPPYPPRTPTPEAEELEQPQHHGSDVDDREPVPLRIPTPPPPELGRWIYFLHDLALLYNLILRGYSPWPFDSKLPYFIFSRHRGPGLDHLRERFEWRWPLARLNQVERLQRTYLPILKKEIKSVERRVNVDLTLFHKITKRNFIVMITGEGWQWYSEESNPSSEAAKAEGHYWGRVHLMVKGIVIVSTLVLNQSFCVHFTFVLHYCKYLFPNVHRNTKSMIRNQIFVLFQ